MIIDDIIEYLEGEGYGPISTRFSTVVGREGICVKQFSITPITQYYSGKQDILYVYQVFVCKQFNELDALTLAEELQDLLQSANFSGHDYQMNGQARYTMPQEYSLDDTGFYIYEFKQQANLTI